MTPDQAPRTPMLVRDRAALADALNALPRPRAVVMTMGAVHAGHLDLVAEATARAQGGSVVATIFVNPLQFGPGEDFEAYPRTEDADLEAFAGAGVDLVYAPSAADMYPGGAPQVRIAPGPLGEAYEGAIRPGHFAGVATVVAKLLARTRADVAVFGEKDAQQLAVIRRMVADLDMDVVIAAVAIHRDPDGLATSSRNRYLSPRQRADALALPRALDAARAAAGSAAAAPDIRAAALDVLAASPDIGVDYLDVVDPADFHPIQADDAGPALVIGAIRVGVARLIDNARVEIAPR